MLEEGVEIGTPDGRLQVAEIDSTYTLGHDIISQTAGDDAASHPIVNPGDVLFLLYDGHGSTRGLVDAMGLPLTDQIYAYDVRGCRRLSE